MGIASGDLIDFDSLWKQWPIYFDDLPSFTYKNEDFLVANCEITISPPRPSQKCRRLAAASQFVVFSMCVCYFFEWRWLGWNFIWKTLRCHFLVLWGCWWKLEAKMKCWFARPGLWWTLALQALHLPMYSWSLAGAKQRGASHVVGPSQVLAACRWQSVSIRNNSQIRTTDCHILLSPLSPCRFWKWPTFFFGQINPTMHPISCIVWTVVDFGIVLHSSMQTCRRKNT